MEDNPEKSAIKEVDQYYELISYGGNNSVDTMKRLKSMVKKSLSS
jgi:hypothetical protein